MDILKKCNHIHSNVAISDEREEKDMMRERGEREGMDNWRSYEGLMKIKDEEVAGERDGVGKQRGRKLREKIEKRMK